MLRSATPALEVRVDRLFHKAPQADGGGGARTRPSVFHVPRSSARMPCDLGLWHTGDARSCPPRTSGFRCRADPARTNASPSLLFVLSRSHRRAGAGQRDVSDRGLTAGNRPSPARMARGWHAGRSSCTRSRRAAIADLACRARPVLGDHVPCWQAAGGGAAAGDRAGRFGRSAGTTHEVRWFAPRSTWDHSFRRPRHGGY